MALVVFAEAFTSEQENFGVLHQAVGDSGRNGGVMQNVSPVRERGIGRDQGAALMAVAGGDDLIEQVGSLLIERKVCSARQGTIATPQAIRDIRGNMLVKRSPAFPAYDVLQRSLSTAWQEARICKTNPLGCQRTCYRRRVEAQTKCARTAIVAPMPFVNREKLN